jgi:hypothetical protein
MIDKSMVLVAFIYFMNKNAELMKELEKK